MTYIVRWTELAVTELHRLERAAQDVAAFRKASERVDYALRRLPEDLGESRGVDERVWYGDVLGVHYRVDTDAMTVLVMAIAPARRRP